jgi:hypothetical protein
MRGGPRRRNGAKGCPERRRGVHGQTGGFLAGMGEVVWGRVHAR